MLQDIKHFFQISRPINLLIAWITYGLACYLSTSRSLDFLSDPLFWITSGTLVLITATGYWINDVYDFRIDRINRPNKTVVNALLSVKKVLTVYFFTMSFIAVFSILIIGGWAGKIPNMLVNLAAMTLLFVYAARLKRIGVVGNLAIAFLISLVLVQAYYLYDQDPSMPILWAVMFSFEITLIREITKDVEDIQGDLKFKLTTLPIMIGIRRTKWVLAGLYLVFWLSCFLPTIYTYQRFGQIRETFVILIALLVQLPCLVLFIKMMRSSRPKEFGFQSRMLKILMILGIVTLFFL
ncbi:geranylgeranylglycerol-phosphate geranylgeranyltransferase [Pontibacter sp. G13]|uniref:geranylgeranylglycerol-phosphate geranylgeranyltransferase n=1 Tax=Pontibacter sp. G13 TaxID=3074898 RepID=UPI00288B17C8|nr:geranylgeranylglycerol-phosphate geranylgeranyltransferase [Pontibacter sp. G13]WNJ16464.1 geranylgeranylglycerol-phosphate geranylgeranyltransferase [Pontibacter sp. G13]